MLSFDQAVKTLRRFWKDGHWAGVTHKDCSDIKEAFAILEARTVNTVIGTINHPVHKLYYIHFDGTCYGISRTVEPIHCGYASLAAMLQTKGL